MEQGSHACPHRCPVNVGKIERWISIAGAVGLLCVTAKREPLAKLAGLAASASLLYRGLTGKCHVYDAIGMSTAASRPNENTVIHNKKGIHVIESMTIQQPVERVYRAWRDFSNLPKFLTHVESVQNLDERSSRWVIQTPSGKLQWNATLIEDKPNELISWKSLEDADVRSAGSIRFQFLQALEATELTVNLRYAPAAGRIAAWMSSFFSDSAEDMIREDLRRFKQIQETGEVPTTEGQPTGIHAAC